jgi:predicted Zn-dependent protease
MMNIKLSQICPTGEESRVVMEAGYALVELGRLEEAEKIFRGIAELLPSSPVPRVALGQVFLMQGRVADAQSACEDALNLCPESSHARVHYAETLLYQRRRAEAEEELRRVIATDPKSQDAQIARNLIEIAVLVCAANPKDV